jgi:hypothetical protein
MRCGKFFSIRDTVAIISCQKGKYHQLCTWAPTLRIKHFKLHNTQCKSLNKGKVLNFKTSFKDPVFLPSTKKETLCYNLKNWLNPSAWCDGQCPHSKNTICRGVTGTARNRQPDYNCSLCCRDMNEWMRACMWRAVPVTPRHMVFCYAGTARRSTLKG